MQLLLPPQLKAVELGVFPCRLTYDKTRQKWKKTPCTVNHESWQKTAVRPLDDPAINWEGVEVVGVPIPEGVVVLDLDSYKSGTSRESADIALRCALPWEFALIQKTIGGGEHYAFRLPDWRVRQGSNFGGVGLDTRIAGKGFICTGKGYTAIGFGVLRMAYPESLPVLHDDCRILLEAPDSTPAVPPPEQVSDDENAHIKDALAHIDPDISHDEWIKYGMALRHHFRTDPDQGFALFDRWSCGNIGNRDCPASYIADEVQHQYRALKPARANSQNITIATIFHAALAGGWQPPARFDPVLAFSNDTAATNAFKILLEKINESGTDSQSIDDLLKAISTSSCNALQVMLLRNELKAALRSARLLDKDLTTLIDQQLTVSTSGSDAHYGKNHTGNALQFIDAQYPDNTLIRCDEIWYRFDGKCWVEKSDAEIEYQIASAMIQSLPQKSTVVGTLGMLANIVYASEVEMSRSPEGLLLFDNGVLEISSGKLLLHDKKYLTTVILPYDYQRDAYASRWHTFMSEVFEGDQERIALLQEWLGYMLSPTYQYQKIMLFIGPRRAGKSLIGEVMHALVGDQNYTGASLESFADDDFLDSLRNKTVAFSGDTAKYIARSKIDRVIERIKKISGNDDVDFGRKYKSRMSCHIPTRLTISANHVPQLFDASEALAYRFIVLPFEVSFVDREDPYLLETLTREIEGIAIWALQGLARLNTNQCFTVPRASAEETAFINESYSPLRIFLDQYCELKGDDFISTKDLYDAYRSWALTEGEIRLMAQKTFVSTFKDSTRGRGVRYGVHRELNQIQRGFKGVKLIVDPGTHSAFQPEIVN